VFARGESMHQKCSTYALTNLLFGLCRFVRIIELFVNLRSPHLEALARPSTPKVLPSQGACPNSFSFRYLHLWTCSEFIKELGGASITMAFKCKTCINLYKLVNGIFVPCYISFLVEYHNEPPKHHKHWFSLDDLS
jgi:hypothetical protein